MARCLARWTSGPPRSSTGPGRAIPALLTSTSTPAPPVLASILAQARRTESSSVTSSLATWTFGMAAADCPDLGAATRGEGRVFRDAGDQPGCRCEAVLRALASS
jgi:hypothetical protein